MRSNKYQPLSILQNMQQQINNLFKHNWFSEAHYTNDVMSPCSVNTDLKEEHDHLLLNINLPGVDPNNIEITIDNNILTVKGERKLEHANKDKNYSIIERFSGLFYRQFSLPSYIDAPNIKASSKNGVLTLVIPKKQDQLNQRISVQVTADKPIEN